MNFGRVLVCATVCTYLVPDLFSSEIAPYVFYAMRGILGAIMASAIYLRLNVRILQWFAIVMWEISSSLCSATLMLGASDCSDATGFNYTMLLCGISLIAIIDYNPQN